MSYARIVAHYPYVVLLAVFVVVATCLVLSTTLVDLPDFSDPMAGFQPRGTEIGKKLIAYENILRNIDNNLSLLPFQNKYQFQKKAEVNDDDDDDNSSDPEDEKGFVKRSSGKDYFFCNLEEVPYSDLARIVFKSVDGSDLFTASKLKQMCRIEEEKIRTHSTFPDICMLQLAEKCCPSWSLGNYVAFLTNRKSCFDITDEDVSYVSSLISSCAGHYYNQTLKFNCDKSVSSSRYIRSTSCENLPENCTSFNIVYNILHHITDINFAQPINQREKPFLTYAITFLPISGSVSTVELYENMESWAEDLDGSVEIVGANFGIKYTLFSQYLQSDTVWLICAAILIFFVIWVYSTSIFISIMTFLMMFWSLELAYFLYMMVFEIKFFPYMNLVTVIIIIAIGADDVFIYSKVWQLAKSERNNGTLEKIVSDTLKHATVSMFVTSFTTASALLVNAISSITSIKCFSIYAGTAVLCNFVLVVTWLPASIVIYDKWCNCEAWYDPEFSTSKNVCYYMCKVPYKMYHEISDRSRILFEKILPFIIIRLRFLWIFTFAGLGIGGIVVIFFHPKLKLPTSEKFQVFSSNHLLERYDFMLNSQFWFEKTHRDRILLPLTFVWGVLPHDDGSYLDPLDTGSLKFDEQFDATTIGAQVWLLKFCKKLRDVDFYQHIPGFQLTNCFFENFLKRYMSRPCLEGQSCCNGTGSSASPKNISQCLKQYIPDLMNTRGVWYNSYSPGPRFTNGRLSAFIVRFQSNQHFSTSYEEIRSFYENAERFLKEELKSAPNEMKNGWFVSELDFFDLQSSFLRETPLAFGLSIAMVAGVSFLTTLNVLISLLAIISIGFIMFTTVASLTLLGWELNILESVVVTVAVGMSVDYTLHYGVSYRLSPDLSQEARIANSVARLGSVISMAAITTFLAGALMMPSTILVYQKFGIFLMIIISISWSYSTFFFQSLLCVFGPRGSFGQFHWPSCDCCSNSSPRHVDKTVYTMSESTLSTSSNYPHTSSTTSDTRDMSVSSEGQCLTPHHQHKRTRSRGNYVRARTRSESPETDAVVRRESHVRFSVSSIERPGNENIDESDDDAHQTKPLSRTDSVFTEPEQKSELIPSPQRNSEKSIRTGSAGSYNVFEKPTRIEVVFRESVT